MDWEKAEESVRFEPAVPIVNRSLFGVPGSVPDIDSIWQIVQLVAQTVQRHDNQGGGFESRDDHEYVCAEIHYEQRGSHSFLE